MPDEIIQSRQNPLVKAIAKLWDRRSREQTDQFLIEGLREIHRAAENEIWIEQLFFCPGLFKDPAAQKELVESARDNEVECIEFGKEAFQKISFREGPDGLLALAVKRSFLLEGASLPENPLLLVIERVEKPGNLGAIIRTAEAAGVDCIICCDPVTDIYNPHVIRNSQGLVFALPVFVEESLKVIQFLKDNQVSSLATTPDTQSSIWSCDMSGPTAIVLGSESDGLTQTWLDQTDQRVLIPMRGTADSLNLSVSAAICLFEAARQRSMVSESI